MHECAESAPEDSDRVVGIYYYKRKVVSRDFLYIFTNVMKFYILIFVHYVDYTCDMKRKLKGLSPVQYRTKSIEIA